MAPTDSLPPFALARPAATSGGVASPGFNIVGFFRNELGIGEAARLFAAVAEAAGYDHAAIAFVSSRHPQRGPFPGEDNPAIHDVNVVYINPDVLSRFVEQIGPGFFHGRYTVGAWAWEVENFPASFRHAEALVDEIWALSRYAAESIACGGSKPVRVFPLPIIPPKPSQASRSDLGLPDGFIFLFCFDFLSVFQRKNPLGVVDAFSRAFRPGEGPHLVIKSLNGQARARQLEQLRASAAERPDIHIFDAVLKAEDQAALLASCDAYVSLHRSEGFGLTMGEAMALGKPVIATGYSGNLEFMNDGNSWLIPYRQAQVPPSCGPYPAGSPWADPSIEAAAHAMRDIYDNPDAALRRGERAKQDVLRNHSLAARAKLLQNLMAEVKLRRLDLGK
jgi:glycosyltransferase involved in cell wall biosynthesis